MFLPAPARLFPLSLTAQNKIHPSELPLSASAAGLRRHDAKARRQEGADPKFPDTKEDKGSHPSRLGVFGRQQG